MSTSKIFGVWGSACLRQILIAILILAVFTTAFVGLSLLAALAPIPADLRGYILPVGLLLLLFFMLVAILTWGVVSIRRRARQLDAAFAPLGLKGKTYLWNGRQYHGTINGRQVDAYFYRGPSLDIYVDCPVQTRLGIGLKENLGPVAIRLLGGADMLVNDPDLAEYSFYPSDENWSWELLAKPQAASFIRRLIPTNPGNESRSLLLRPDALQYQLSHTPLSSLTPENIRTWVDVLRSLADIAETLPPPLVTENVTFLESQARSQRSQLNGPVLALFWGFLMFISLLIFLVMLAYFLLGRGGLSPAL